jgi:antitoxin CptB
LRRCWNSSRDGTVEETPVSLRVRIRAKGSASNTGNSPLADEPRGHYMALMDGMNSCDALEARRKRLLFRAQRRGFKEVDLIFGNFAALAVVCMSEGELDQFEALLMAPDQEVYAWLQGEAPVAHAYDNAVFAAVKAFCGRKEPVWNV